MGYAFATPLLAPLLLLQGLRVRRTVPQLPEPPGERAGQVGSGDLLRLLVIGDSSAAGVGAPTQSQALIGHLSTTMSLECPLRWRLEAKTGATTASTLKGLSEVEPEEFDLAVSVLGVNDVTSPTSVGSWLDNQALLRNLLRARFGVKRIVVCGLPPMGEFPALPQPLRWYLGSKAKRFDAAIGRAVGTEENVHYFPLDFARDVALMAKDGFHPGPGAYADWGRRLGEFVLTVSSFAPGSGSSGN